MKTVQTYFFAFLLLLVSQASFAQQQNHRSAAEALEKELANKRTGIPAAPLDEKLTENERLAQPETTPLSEPADKARSILTGDDEKAAAQPDPNYRIPEPPLDESVTTEQITDPKPISPVEVPSRPQARVKAQSPANPNEVEAQQHKLNGHRSIPSPPKAESNSNQR